MRHPLTLSPLTDFKEKLLRTGGNIQEKDAEEGPLLPGTVRVISGAEWPMHI